MAMMRSIISFSDAPLNLAFPGVIIVAAFCGLWSMVNFHRHILLKERFGWRPRPHIREMLNYGITATPMRLLIIVWNIASIMIGLFLSSESAC